MRGAASEQQQLRFRVEAATAAFEPPLAVPAIPHGIQLFVNGVPYELIRQVKSKRARGAQVWWVKPLFTGAPEHSLTIHHTDRCTFGL